VFPVFSPCSLLSFVVSRNLLLLEAPDAHLGLALSVFYDLVLGTCRSQDTPFSRTACCQRVRSSPSWDFVFCLTLPWRRTLFTTARTLSSSMRENPSHFEVRVVDRPPKRSEGCQGPRILVSVQFRAFSSPSHTPSLFPRSSSASRFVFAPARWPALSSLGLLPLGNH